MRGICLLTAMMALGLAACSSGKDPGGAQDKYAGLDAQILSWRTDLEAHNTVCADKAGGHGCQAFEVACKGELPVTAQDRAKGVSAKLVTAITFNGWTPKSGETPGSAFANFTKTGGTWTRTEAKPVNLSTCAPT